MYRRLYPSWYKNRLYPSCYEKDEGGNNKVLVTIWFEAKDKSILGSLDRYVTMILELHSLLDVSCIKRIIISIIWSKTSQLSEKLRRKTSQINQ